RYVASEKDPLYLHSLRNRFLRTPNVEVAPVDANDPASIAAAGREFDTVLAVNVLETVDDVEASMRAVAGSLESGGRLIALVPQGPSLKGSLDETLGIRRRFRRENLAAILAGAGFQVEEMISLNRIGAAAWWLFGRVLRRRHINKITLKIFDKTVWLWRRIDGLLPWPGVSLVVVARKAEPPPARQ
ncbi:MAG TPA: methyltransferase domain-containing protein, partial [Vicinamibacterales bacterium]|nr:methyltransferase domain-containing protein [Vicinamibacterales bacterium]